MENIRWAFYPHAAACERARSWIEIQRRLLRAPKTIDAYARGIDDFLAFCGRRSVRAESATRTAIASYVEDLATRPRKRSLNEPSGVAGGLANSTIQQRLTAIRLFFDFLIEEGVQDSNPVGRGRYTAGSGFCGHRERGLVHRYRRTPWIPSDQQWELFLELLLREQPIRNQLMALMAYDGALRRSELLSLKISDIDFPHQKLVIRPEVAKYRSGRVVFYGNATSDLLAAYVQQDRRTPRADRQESLFVSHSHRNRGRALTFEMWNKIVHSVAAKASLPHFTTHTFRHLRLTDLARCRLDLQEIAVYAGHRNPKTTLQYIQLSGRPRWM